MLQFRIASKIFALQPCTTVWSVCPRECYRFPSESALCRTLDLAPYISSIYVPIYAVKQRFDFESGFSFRDLLFGVKLTLNWFYSIVIDQNRSSDPKSCDYRYLSIILTNRLISTEKYRVISIYRLPFRSSILIDLLRPD